MDSTIDPEPDASDDSNDLAVEIGTLELDGTRPSVGDSVEVKVGGTISKIVNDTAFVTPKTVNDAPITSEDQSLGEEDMKAMANNLGSIDGY